MADPFAPSTDPGIPTPSTEDLLNLVHAENRDQLAAGSLPAKVAETLWADARKQWDEGHKRDAARRAEEGKATIGLPLVGSEPEEVPRDDSGFSGTFGDVNRPKRVPTKTPSIDAGVRSRPDYPTPSPSQIRQDRMWRAIQSGGKPDPEDIAEEEAEAERYRRRLAEARERKRKEVEAEFAKSEKAIPGAGPSPRALRAQGDPRNVGSSREKPTRQPEVQVDRATKVTARAGEVLRHKPVPPPPRRSFSRPKLVGAIIVAFVALVGSVAGAFQVAGVLSVALAHSLLVLGWVGFMASLLRIEHIIDSPHKNKVLVTAVAGVVSAFFLFGMDRWMINLKAQQQPVASAIPVQHVPSPAVQASNNANTNGERRVPLDIAPEKLLEFFDKYNHAQAEALVRPYLGKWMDVSGRVVDVRRELLIPNESGQRMRDGIEVTFETLTIKKAKSTVAIQAMFEEQRWMDRAVVLKRNERIRVRGQLKSVLASSFSLEHCEIIE